MMDFDRRHALLAVVIVLAAVGAVGAQTYLFTAGSGGTINATDGSSVTLGEDLGLAGDNPVAVDGSVTIQDTTIDGPAGSSAAFSIPTSSARTLANIDTNSGTLEASTAGIQTVEIQGAITQLTYRDVDLASTATEFDVATTGSGTLLVHGFSAGYGLRVQYGNGSETLVTTNQNGVAAIPIDATTSITLLQPAGAPTLTNPSPTGGETLTSSPAELAVNVTDGDFPAGDNVTLDWYVDGVLSGTTYATSNGTKTFQNTTATGGTHTWHVTATDETGATVRLPSSGSYTYALPDKLYIRNESNPSQLVGEPPNITVRFFGDNSNQVYERSGNPINMTGLPVDQDFIVEVEASDDYHARTIYIQSLIQQQNAYLLPTNISSVETRFVLDDPTGQYDSETILFVEMPIQRNGSLTYETVHADQFGVEGVTATLRDGVRYNIRIQSPDGTGQQIGPYRGDVSESVTVQPGAPSIPLTDYTMGWAADATLNNRTLEYRYSDPAQETGAVTIWIHEKNNASHQLRPNQTFLDVGNVSGQVALTENESEKTWVVAFDAQRNDGQLVVARDVANRVSLVPNLSDEWRLVVALAALFISAGVFSLLNRGVGAVVTAITGAILFWTGWLDGVTAAAGVVIAIFVAVLYNIYTSSGF